jgi:hypothetical protein
MLPESVGLTTNSLVLGKHSGRHAFKKRLETLGYGDLTDQRLDELVSKFKILAGALSVRIYYVEGIKFNRDTQRQDQKISKERMLFIHKDFVINRLLLSTAPVRNIAHNGSISLLYSLLTIYIVVYPLLEA